MHLCRTNYVFLALLDKWCVGQMIYRTNDIAPQIYLYTYCPGSNNTLGRVHVHKVWERGKPGREHEEHVLVRLGGYVHTGIRYTVAEAIQMHENGWNETKIIENVNGKLLANFFFVLRDTLCALCWQNHKKYGLWDVKKVVCHLCPLQNTKYLGS